MYNETCKTSIRAAFDLLVSLKTQPDTHADIDTIFNTCANSSIKTNGAGYIDKLIDLYFNGFAYMAMTNYPYAANFLQPMPAWPCKEACQRVYNIYTST